MNNSLIDLAEIGWDIKPKHSERLQELVSDKILRQVEESVLVNIAFNPESSEIFSALLAVREFPKERRMKILLHPSFRYWLKAMRRTSQSENLDQHFSFARKLVDFVWSEQASSGQLDKSWTTMTDERGGLRCPSLGRFIELGTSYTNCIVQITSGSEAVVIQCMDGLTIQIPFEDLRGPLIEPLPTLEDHGYLVSIAPALADGLVEVSSRDPWLRVKLTGTNQRTTGTEFFGTDIDHRYPDWPSLANLDEAFQLLKSYWTEGFDDLARFTHVIVPMDFGPHTYSGFTVSSRQGAIYIGNAPPDATVEMLIHENAHVKLRQIQFLDSLLSDPSDESIRLPVPWRTDPRPIPGIFEGLFVFSHVAEFELRRLHVDGTGVNSEQLEKRIHALHYAAQCLERHAKFTEEGLTFFTAMFRWVEQLDERFASLTSSK
jgi:HEXXH motif-containing protein